MNHAHQRLLKDIFSIEIKIHCYPGLYLRAEQNVRGDYHEFSSEGPLFQIKLKQNSNQRFM